MEVKFISEQESDDNSSATTPGLEVSVRHEHSRSFPGCFEISVLLTGCLADYGVAFREQFLISKYL